MCVKCTLCTGVRYFHLQCFQSSCLSITFSPPLAQIRQADSLSQVKPSRRHWWPSPSEPRLPTHTHAQSTPTTPSLPPQLHSQDSRYFTLSAKGLLGSHRISVWRLASCHHQQSWEGAHPCSARHHFQHKPVIGPHYLWHFLHDY